MRHRAWLCTLLAFGVAHAQTLLPSSGILYPADATGVAAISMRQLSNGLCPDTMTSSQRVTVTELTIAGARQAMLEGTLTCTELVQAYISRTNIYDQALQLNAVRELDATGALAAARAADGELRQAIANGTGHSLPSLFCVPMLLKDNIDMVGLPTTAGAVALADNYPATDAWVVRRLKAAGAIMLGKSNMGEFALFPSFSLSSLAGFTRNPYHLHYTPAGSSGGSAAAVSANLAMAALGTDTGNSVRGPAAHAGVVGLRPSIGLVGKTGVVPLREDRDTVGPLARTVADAAAVLGALVGLDPDDAVSAHELGAGAPLGNAPPENYTDFLEVEALAGARIGVFRQILNIPGTNVQIRSLFETALYTMQAQGAELADNFTIRGNSLGEPWDANRNGEGPALGHWNVNGTWEDLWACNSPFREGVNAYLSTANATANPKSLADVYNEGGYHPLSRDSIVAALEAVEATPDDFPTELQKQQGQYCGCSYWWKDPCRTEFRKRFIQSMDAEDLDVVVYPTWNLPPLKIGDSFSDYYDGNNSPMIAPQTGGPAITVPMGQSTLGLPMGITFLARPFEEGLLLRIAHAFELATNSRTSPPLFADCAGNVAAATQVAG